jgi:hypothetical protein
MCKLVKKLMCIAIISFLLFIGITVWGEGGAKFRELGEKTGGIVQKATDKLADAADSLVGSIKEKLERSSGKKKEKSQEK